MMCLVSFSLILSILSVCLNSFGGYLYSFGGWVLVGIEGFVEGLGYLWGGLLLCSVFVDVGNFFIFFLIFDG